MPKKVRLGLSLIKGVVGSAIASHFLFCEIEYVCVYALFRQNRDSMKKPKGKADDGMGIVGAAKTKKKRRWQRWRWRRKPTKKVGNVRSLE